MFVAHRFRRASVVAFALFATVAVASPRWVPTNGPYGGLVYDFTSRGPGAMFIAEASGLFRSTDDGQTWSQLATGLPSGFRTLDAVCIDSAGDVIAGTFQRGLVKSTDNGDTWSAINNGIPDYFATIAFNVAPWGDIYARANTNDGEVVYASSDRGASWNIMDTIGIPQPISIGSLAVAATPTEVLLASVFRADDSTYLLFRSTDRGATWKDAHPVGLPAGDTIVSVTAANASSTFFATTYHIVNSVYDYRNFRSTDNGSTWTEVSTNAAGLYTALFPVWSGVDDPVFAVGVRNNTETGAVYSTAIYVDVFRSTDLGVTWVATGNAGRESVPVSALHVDRRGSVFAMGNFGGVYRSTNEGESWDLATHGLKSALVTRLGVDSTGRLFAGTFESGTYRSTDRGNTWEHLTNGIPRSGSFQFAACSDGVIVAGDTTTGILRSTDHGDSWMTGNVGLSDTKVGALAIAPNGNVFIGTGAGVYVSTDEGQTWSARSNGLPQLGVYALTARVPGALLAGTPLGVYRSTDEGMNWEVENNGLQNPHVYSLWVTASGAVLMGTSPGPQGGVFRSEDGGLQWSYANSGISPSSTTYSMANGLDGSVYAGTVFFTDDFPPTGLYRSTDDGRTWMVYDTGYTVKPTISPAVIVAKDGAVYVGTAFEGVMRLDATAGVAPHALPASEDVTIFPNPAANTCVVRVPSAATGAATVTVCDAIGRVVQSYTVAVRDNAEQNLQVNTESLVPGVYSCVVVAHGTRNVRPLIVMR